MREHLRFFASIVLASAIFSTPVGAGQFGFLKRESKQKFQPFKDPGGRFSLDSPKDWQIVGGAGDVLVTFAQRKSEAALIVELFLMNQVLAPDEITDLFAQIEVDVLNERQPKATDVTTKILDVAGHRLIVIDYARPGLTRAERVRQYSFPIGQQLYRLTCSAMTAQFPKYDPVFAHVAESFKSEPAKPSTRPNEQ